MAKHDKLRKLARNKTIRQYYKDNPNVSYEEIGKIFLKEDGTPLSRARVCQILKGD